MEHWELIAKKLSGELSSEEERSFADWLQSDPSHEATWKEMQQLWNSSATIDRSFEADTEHALEKVKSRLTGGTTTAARPAWIKYAAAVAAIAVIGAIIGFLLPGKNGNADKIAAVDSAPKNTAPVMAAVVMKEISTTDSARVVYLPDSSRIILNKHSRISYPENFSDTVRLVTLDGEAFFDVTHDAQKPFVIHAGKSETRVYGTTFNLKAYENEDDIEVTVITGKVSFAINDGHKTQPAMLLADDRLTYSKSSSAWKKQKAPRNENMWWVKTDIEKDLRHFLKDAKKTLIKPTPKKKKRR